MEGMDHVELADEMGRLAGKLIQASKAKLCAEALELEQDARLDMGQATAQARGLADSLALAGLTDAATAVEQLTSTVEMKGMSGEEADDAFETIERQVLPELRKAGKEAEVETLLRIV